MSASKVFSTRRQLAEMARVLSAYLRLPFSTDTIPGALMESLLAHAFAIQSKGPLLVAGDFNMPEESAIYRRHWSGLNNAFSCAGYGFGTSKETRWHGIRIDHVLLGPGWSCLHTQVGPHLGGDHRPMVADLAWSGAP